MGSLELRTILKMAKSSMTERSCSASLGRDPTSSGPRGLHASGSYVKAEAYSRRLQIMRRRFTELV